MQGNRYENGFSFVEVLIAIILVGLAIASLIAANSSFTKANAAGTDLSTAEFLIEQIRELTVLMPVVDPNTEISTFGPEADETSLADYDDLDDFDGAAFSPPISADRATLNDFAAFTQQITVENISAGDFEQVVGDHSSFFVRVTVKVFFNTREISSAGWIRAWSQEP
ncbi:MAG TPA: prepilin-type N-terminal cleavage/methylation domain-containing protein [Sedimentisphaerales bacterium]|nr:prepilin-type N-terminal cleavage/methylation domain-containing protein [Sedimentisphaerales bacterium]